MFLSIAITPANCSPHEGTSSVSWRRPQSSSNNRGKQRHWTGDGAAVCGRGRVRVHHRPSAGRARQGQGGDRQNVTTVQGDISNLDDLERLYSTVKKEKGILHIVVANAGITELAIPSTATPEHYDKTYNIIARGAPLSGIEFHFVQRLHRR